MRLERTKNTVRNTVWGTVNRLVTQLCPFAVRTCIIYCLGAEYTGLTSLFSSILSMLSFAELGFGTAIVYSMYQPVAEENEEKICELMNLYKWIYRLVGAFVFAVGIILIPFLPKFIKGSAPADINIYILYGIYLFNSGISYWLFSYKNCLLTVFQRNDVASNISSIVHIAMYSLQIVLLIVLKNYYFYAICLPIATVLINLCTAHFTSKMFPNYKSYGRVSKEEIKSIKKQVVGLLSQRLAFQSRNSFDSIIISSFLGLTVVAIYNNYFYIINAATAILAMLFTSMQGGIGNSVANETINKNYDDFRRINFLYMWLSGLCTVLLAVLFQPFMKIWVGSDLMFSNAFAVIMAYYFLFMKFTDPIGAYISATGLWWNCKVFYIVEGLVNLTLNIGLGYLFGVSGVVWATVISVVFANFVPSVFVLHKNYFVGYRIKGIIIDDIKYLVTISIALLLSYFINSFIPDGTTFVVNAILLILRFVICMIVSNVVFLVLYSKNKQWIESKKWLSKSFPFVNKFLK